MMKQISILSIVCCWMVSHVVAQVSAKEPVDISSDIEKLLKDSRVPSLAAAALLNGKIISRGAAGIRKQGEKTKVTVDDKYHLGSCTKSMTATLTAMLVESGKLNWDTTVSEVFRDVKIDQTYKKTTLRQLLTSTAGVPAEIEPKLWNALWKAKGELPAQRLQLVRGILAQPADYVPGTKQIYSNAGFSIAGAMLEKVTGKSYEELLKELLFKPLFMNSAGFRAPATNGKIDQPYGHVLKSDEVTAIEPEPAGDNPAAIAPAGAVHCSITDFARYANFHLGRQKLLSKESMKTLHTPAKDTNYAMGWMVTERKWAGGKAFTHTGSNTMFYAVIWIAPEKDFAAVAVCNYGGTEAFQKCDEAIALLIKKHL